MFIFLLRLLLFFFLLYEKKCNGSSIKFRMQPLRVPAYCMFITTHRLPYECNKNPVRPILLQCVRLSFLLKKNKSDTIIIFSFVVILKKCLQFVYGFFFFFINFKHLCQTCTYVPCVFFLMSYFPISDF